MDRRKRTEALILLYLILIFFLVLIHRASLFRCAGGLFYSYDDAYIHMSMAKNLVRHGVLGITRYSYTPASSSPLWTFILAFFYLIFGINTWVPLALNLIFFFLLVWFAWKMFSRFSLTWNFLLTLLFILALPGYFVVYMGMEHTLQLLLVFLLSLKILDYFTGKTPGWEFYILLALSMGARYETVFIAFFLFIYFSARRHWGHAALVLISILPFPVIYGILNLTHGWGFLPASVAVKGNSQILKYLFSLDFPGAFKSFLADMAFKLQAFSSAVLSFEIFLFFLWAFLFLVYFSGQDKEKWAFYLFPPYMVLMQFVFALYSYPPRYENYLLAVLVPFTLCAVEKRKFRNLIGDLILAGLFLGLLVPRFLINYKTPIGAEGIFSQQYQMAMFLKRFYPRGKVVLNDIGVVSFYNENLRIEDYVGLATKKPWRIRTSTASIGTKAKLLKEYLTSSDADLAIAFEDWIKPLLPDNWKEIGRWRLLRNLVLPDVEVVFYEVKDPELPLKLRMNSVFLPDVVEGGIYTRTRGLVRYGNLVLWAPKKSVFLGPNSSLTIPLNLTGGYYRVLVRARGLGSILQVESLGEVKLDKFPFYPYELSGEFSGKTLVLRNPSGFPLVFREILLQKGP